MVTLTINLFASLREELGASGETLPLPEQVTNVAQLVDYLVGLRGERWAVLQDNTRVLVAVDHTIVQRSHALRGGEEVAFFPPMTGG
jgi:molybdopterin synthase sulfur carrier subunit